MIRKIFTRAVLVLIMCNQLAIPSFAAEKSVGQQTTSIPVTLTIVQSVKKIDVTMPAAFPVSVVDGKVLTATNVEIRNNSEKVGVEIASVKVTNGTYSVADFAAFPTFGSKKIAININGCQTKKSGELAITKKSFPDINPTQALAIDYNAKVLGSSEVKGEKAANVIFTLKALN